MNSLSKRSPKNPYAQVAFTYLRRPFSSFAAGLLFLFWFVLWLWSLSDSRSCLTPLPFVCGAMLYSGVAMHILEQFVDPRAQLTPGFRRAHFTVAAAAVVVFAVFLPALITWRAGLHSVGFTAIMLFLCGVVFWSVLLRSLFDIGWFFVLILIAFSATPASSMVERFVSGQFEIPALFLSTFGVVIIFLAGLRLARLNEEMPAYRSFLHWLQKYRADEDQVTGQDQSDVEPRPRGLRHWLAERQMTVAIRHARRAAASRWSRVCRWQLGMAAGPSLWLWGIGTILFLQLMTLDHYLHRDKAKASPDTSFFFLMFTFAPAFIVVFAGEKRRKGATYELLLPVARTSYFQQLGAAAAIAQLCLWGVMNAAMIVQLLVVFRTALSFDVLAGALAISALCQIGLFGAVVWLLQCQSLPGLVVIVPTALAPILLMNGQLSDPPIEQPSLIWFFASLFAAFGVLLTWDAYRRWLKTDFD